MPQTRRPAWIFDIDGVLTDMSDRTLHEPIIASLSSLLKRNEPVALNTGRSVAWTDTVALTPIEYYMKQNVLPPRLLRNLFAVSEKGATWITYSPEGKRHTAVDSAIVIPAALRKQVENVLVGTLSSNGQTLHMNDFMYVEDKTSMITAEMKVGVKIEDFRRCQKLLEPIIQKIIADRRWMNDFKVVMTNIAVDVESRNAGKGLGAQRVIDWLKEKSDFSARYYTFGDSQEDIEMAQRFAVQFGNSKVTFIFVGTEVFWKPEQYPFPVLHYPKYDNGTLAFLSTLPD